MAFSIRGRGGLVPGVRFGHEAPVEVHHAVQVVVDEDEGARVRALREVEHEVLLGVREAVELVQEAFQVALFD